MTTLAKPAIRPARPEFSSGPCAKRPGWTPENLQNAVLGRSHRSKLGKARLKAAIDQTREVLEVPADFLIGIVAGSDTGAVEMALWSMLGARPVQLMAFESFGKDWVTDVTKQLKLPDVEVLSAPYGQLPDTTKVDPAKDLVFTWNGTTSGVRVPNADFISADREGITICDATSAAFAQDLDWTKLDVVTFSWQKALGGEGAHGVLILSPRAVARRTDALGVQLGRQAADLELAAGHARLPVGLHLAADVAERLALHVVAADGDDRHLVGVAAEQLAHATESVEPRSLPDVGLITSRVRTDDVIVELTDRLGRVRQRAWELVNSPDRSVAALRDLATIGVAVHAHAAAFHAGPRGPAGTLIARGRSWQTLGSRLAALVSPAPHDDVVRADLTALARILPAVAPLSGPGRAHEADPTIRRTGAALGGAVAVMTEVADHNARTFAKITRTSTVYVPARAMTGDEITDHPELVRARLDGRLAPAPERQLHEVDRLYQNLRNQPSHTPTRGPALVHAQADRVVDVEPIGVQVDA